MKLPRCAIGAVLSVLSLLSVGCQCMGKAYVEIELEQGVREPSVSVLAMTVTGPELEQLAAIEKEQDAHLLWRHIGQLFQDSGDLGIFVRGLRSTGRATVESLSSSQPKRTLRVDRPELDNGKLYIAVCFGSEDNAQNHVAWVTLGETCRFRAVVKPRAIEFRVEEE